MAKFDSDQLRLMPNYQLREIYKNIKLRQKRFSKLAVFFSVPFILFYFFMGWQWLKGTDIAWLFDCSLTGMLDYLNLGLCGIMLMSDDKRFICWVPIIFAALTVLKYVLLQTLALISIAHFVYFTIACIILFGDLKVLDDLKAMADFPFRRRFD